MSYTRRDFLQAAGAAGVALGAASTASWAMQAPGEEVRKEKSKRPNIIVMLTDDQTFSAMGCMGNPVIQTPEMDRLAGEGVLFRKAFVTTAICCVSRASVLSGQYARRNGIDQFHIPFSDEALHQTYPALLQKSGYYTGFIGKWGVGATDQKHLDHAAGIFDFWAGASHQTNFFHERDCPYVVHDGVTNKTDNVCTCPADKRGVAGPLVRCGKHNIKDPVHVTTEITPDKMASFLDQRDPDKPFCMSISFKAPHAPWEDWDPKLADLYEGMFMPVSPTVNPASAETQPEFLRKSLESKRGLDMATRSGFDGPLQNYFRHYYRLITGIDIAIGKIREQLAAHGVDDNTVIIFLSDNGCFMGEHALFGKWLMYEESIRVPMFVYDPRPGQTLRGVSCDEMVLNIDVAPTVLSMAGVGVPAAMQGQDLTPLLTKPETPFREEWFYEHHTVANLIVPSEGVRTRDWKYIRYLTQDPVHEELYDLKNDPHEVTNLAGDPAYAMKLDALRDDWRRLRRELE